MPRKTDTFTTRTDTRNRTQSSRRHRTHITTSDIGEEAKETLSKKIKQTEKILLVVKIPGVTTGNLGGDEVGSVPDIPGIECLARRRNNNKPWRDSRQSSESPRVGNTYTPNKINKDIHPKPYKVAQSFRRHPE